MAFPLESVITGGASLIGNAFNALSQGSQNRKNREFTLEMWQRQNAVNDANWHRDNMYNSPANQRKLLEEGGYNPALLYDKGGFQSASSPAAPTANSPATKAPEFDVNSVIGSYQNARMLPAQLDNLETATRVAAANSAAEVGLKTAQTADLTQGTSHKAALFGAASEAAKLANELTKAQTINTHAAANLSADQRVKIQQEVQNVKQQMQHEKDKHPLNMEILRKNKEFQQFKASLNALGLTEHDSVLWRVFGNLFREHPVSEDKPYNW